MDIIFPSQHCFWLELKGNLFGYSPQHSVLESAVFLVLGRRLHSVSGLNPLCERYCESPLKLPSMERKFKTASRSHLHKSFAQLPSLSWHMISSGPDPSLNLYLVVSAEHPSPSSMAAQRLHFVHRKHISSTSSMGTTPFIIPLRGLSPRFKQ